MVYFERRDSIRPRALLIPDAAQITAAGHEDFEKSFLLEMSEFASLWRNPRLGRGIAPRVLLASEQEWDILYAFAVFARGCP